MLRYKVVETTTVTDESLESIINTWVAEGWHYDSIRFVSSEGSRRPAMAFLFFTHQDQSSQSSTSR